MKNFVYKSVMLLCITLGACTAIPKIQPQKTAYKAATTTYILPKKMNNNGKISLEWLSPKAETTNTGSVAGQVEIKIKIKSKSDLVLEQITVLVNGKSSGNKAGEIGLKRNSLKDNVLSLQVTIPLGKSDVEVVVNKSFEEKYSIARTFHRSSSGMVMKAPKINQGAIRFIWSKPKILALQAGESVRAKKPQFPIAISISAPSTLTRNDVELWFNGTKMSTSTRDFSGQLGTYELKKTLFLDEKRQINTAFVRVQKQGKTVESKRISVHYAPDRPNLYVLAIGPKSNLAYADKDALDFADCMSKQSKKHNGLFEKVNIEKCTGRKASARNISVAIAGIPEKLRAGTIHEDDVVIVFFSTHGTMRDGNLFLHGDDYNPLSLLKTSVSYQAEVVDVLSQMNCKKLLFIDACHSGGSRTDSRDIIKSILSLKSKKGLAIFASSQAEELSYEDPKWENGAFTEAIIEALTDNNADDSGDQIISLNELEKYVCRRVPILVEQEKGSGISQHPIMTRNEMNDVPLFLGRE